MSVFRGRFGKACRLTVAALLAGCIDLVPVAPPPDRAASLFVSVRIGDTPVDAGQGVLVTVTGSLEPGREADGRERGVSNDTLWVAGEPLAPLPNSEPHRLLYSKSLQLQALLLETDGIRVEAPRVETLPPVELVALWPVWKKGDAATVLAPGTDLTLRIVPSRDTSTPPTSFERWAVSVFHRDGWASKGADGLPSGTILVPASLLDTTGSVLAVVNVLQSGEVTSAGGEYVVRLELTQELRWNVVVEAGAALIVR